MSLQHAAQHLATHGRGPDTELVHMTKGEINSLQTLAKANGGSLTINPHTGLAEAGFLSSILPTVVGGAAMYFSGGTINPATIGMITGGLQYARTGSLNKGLMAGMGAYGGAGLAGGLMGAGAAAAEQGALNQSAAESARLGMSQAPFDTAAKEAVANTSNADLMSKGVSSLGQPGGFTNLSNTMSASGGPSLGRAAFAAAAPALLSTPKNEQPQVQSDSKMPQRLQYNAGRPTDAQGNTVTPPPDVPTYASGMGSNFGKEQNYFPNAGYTNITDEQAKGLRGYKEGGELNLAGEYSRDLPSDLETSYSHAERKNDRATMRGIKSESDLRERLKNPKMYASGGDIQGDPNAMQVPTFDPVVRMAHGGLSDLGGYSDGGRLLRGPGDGVSDSIPASIGNKRPARLADGEFVVPARIVSELGNGSTEAGARKLYAMLDRVQKARGKTTGKGKVAKNSRADKFLPA